MKNLLIEQQVEEADRVAPPRPAASHVAWAGPSRRDRRLRDALQRREQRRLTQNMVAIYVLGLVTAVVLWGAWQVGLWLG